MAMAARNGSRGRREVPMMIADALSDGIAKQFPGKVT